MSLALLMRYGLTRHAATVAPPPGASTGVVSFGAAGSSAALSEQLGYEFTVGDRSLPLVALRYWAGHSSAASGTHDLRLWDRTNNVAIATVSVGGSEGEWTEGAASRELQSHGTYVVTARRDDAGSRTIERDHASIVMSDRISFVTSRFLNGTGFPSSTTGVDYRVLADIVFDEPSGVEPFRGIQSQLGFATNTFSQRLGWRFTVGGSDITVNRLRVLSPGTGAERVRIHRHSDGALIATADVAPVAGVWTEVAISSVTLNASTDYVVSSRRTDGSSRSVYQNPSTDATFTSGITKVSGNAGNLFGTTDNIPTSTSSNRWTFMDFGS
jgi:hypothetical protein